MCWFSEYSFKKRRNQSQWNPKRYCDASIPPASDRKKHIRINWITLNQFVYKCHVVQLHRCLDHLGQRDAIHSQIEESLTGMFRSHVGTPS